MRKLAMILAGLMAPNFCAAEISWSDAIEAVREKGGAYYDFALQLGSGHPGTSLHGIGHERHSCAIIGRMLGFIDEIVEVETFEDPPMTSQTDPFALMEHSMFLDSWVAAAESALVMSNDQRKSLWNLECIGKFGIPTSSYILEQDLNADFSVKDGSLLVYGDIESGFYERFVSVLNENSGITHVALGSAGGSVRDAMLSGIEIRKRGLSTALHGPCYSACPLVFMGGRERGIWSGNGPALGFHRVYTSEGEVPLDHFVYDQIEDYLISMGILSEPVLRWMASKGQYEIYEPALEELCPPKVATWVQRTCG